MRSSHFARLMLLFVPLSLFLTACKGPGEETGEARSPTEVVPAGIDAYTTGVIGKDESIYVVFGEMPEGEAAAMISISPARPGSAQLNGNSLSYTPEAGWASGTTYTAKVTVAGIDKFSFTFSTPARRAEVVSDGLFIPGNGGGVQVTGRVMTNDAATVEEIGRLLSAKQGSKAIDVAVEAGADNRNFSYVIQAPDRGKAPAPVTINFDGGQSGFSDSKGEITVSIPADDDFRVESVVVLDTEDNALLARFSDALNGSQDLTGLITFPDNTAYTTRVNGNLLFLYPKSDNLGDITIGLSNGIQNEAGARLGRETSWRVNLGRTEPEIRLVGAGTIMPHQGKRLFTFEAIGLRAVRLEIVRIFAGNVGQYLQNNSLEDQGDDWSLRHVGKIIVQEKVSLSSLSESVSPGRWTRYALNLDKYVKQDVAAIYQVRLGFAMEDGLAGCDVAATDFGLEPLTDGGQKTDFRVGFENKETMLGDYYSIYGYYNDYDWRDEEDPCKPAYYHRNRFLIQNVLSSNLGLIAKRNPDRSTIVFATDLVSASPFPGTRVRAYSAQRQELFSGTTDAEGRVFMTTEEEPVLLIADTGNDAAYLTLDGQTALGLSRFAISGVAAEGGIKGAFYAERGVWRPGDTVYLNFVLEDRQQRVPDSYPIEFTLTDARGRVVERRNVKPAFGKGFYPLTFTTNKKDATGSWTATVKAGGQVYSRTMMIETVKPNRLAIELELPAGGLRPQARNVTLVGKWLYGAPASKLRATVETSIFPRPADFPKWTGYAFTDPARSLEGGSERIFDGTLDEAGRASFAMPLGGDNLPGPVTAGVSTKVFEVGGNFSIDNQRIPFDPYAVYAGVNVPEDEWGSRCISREAPTTVALAAVNTKGEPAAGRKLKAGLYRVSWSYWWQDNNDNVARFNSSNHTEALEKYDAVSGADGAAEIRVKVNDWGRYLLRVCDEGGHCAGQYFYAGWNEEETDRESASLLRPVADKEEVSIGDKVNIKLPTSAGGRLLVSLETSAGSVEQFWVDADAGQTSLSFTADERMVPTVYANITLLQPYDQTTNDRPIRLYGLVPITVTDPATVLNPEITAAKEWRPKSTVDVKVKESGGKSMTYTLAVVDEGLLGLTRFQTPNLHDRFFAKEALGVRTFDLYKYVLGSLNGEFGKVLAIGGDGEAGAAEDQTANRFEPVVRHLGPFRLAGGKTATHQLNLPNYVGAVRVMVVATGDRAYGSDEARIPVVQPLMVLPTLPRVLGPGERVDMPVNTFAMNDKVKNVSLSVTEANGLVRIPTGKAAVTFNKVGNQTSFFPLEVGSKVGIARFLVSGTGNGEQASQEIEIDIRHPNEIVSRAKTIALAPGESKAIPYENFGVGGTRGADLELSALPAMQLDRHLRYLLRYPYGCVEQTISPAFAQLYLDRVTKLTAEQERSRKQNVKAGIDKLRNFQTGSGGLGYWPGDRDPHPWATNYALHFLTEAGRAGFNVPADLRDKLLKFQANVAGNWREATDPFYDSKDQRRRDQAYRLYTLALAGKAELGAMNRLKTKSAELPATAVYQLAAAYALAGQAAASKSLMAGQNAIVKPYRELGYTFGSDIRDMAMILEAQLAADDQTAAGKQVFLLAERIGSRNWLSTQEAAFAFVAIGKISAVGDREMTADFTSPTGARTAVGADNAVYNIALPADGASATFTLKNNGKATLYATVVTSGKPAPGEEQVVNENLVLNVQYTDEKGNAVDVSSLPSGTDFIANYTVRNPGTLGMNYRQLALRSLLPSGWEVSNDRLDATDTPDAGGYAYRDFRDDRVYTFFDLARGESKTFSLRMTATYPGRYYLPAQTTEAMYANDVKAGVKGQWVEVGR